MSAKTTESKWNLKKQWKRVNREFNQISRSVEKTLKKTKPLWKNIVLQARGYQLQEVDGRFELVVEIPGCDPRSLKIEATDTQVVVTAEKFPVLRGISGKIKRTIVLPPTAVSNEAQAVYKNGVLKVSFPKVQAEQIPVTHEHGNPAEADSSGRNDFVRGPSQAEFEKTASGQSDSQKKGAA
jgi:HSP20 family protein